MNEGAAIGIAMLFGALAWWVSPYQRWKLKRLAWAAVFAFLGYAAVASGAALDIAVGLFQSMAEG